MTTRAKVAVLRTQPETVLQDYARLFALAGGAEALARHTTTILKDNISWHFPNDIRRKESSHEQS